MPHRELMTKKCSLSTLLDAAVVEAPNRSSGDLQHTILEALVNLLRNSNIIPDRETTVQAVKDVFAKHVAPINLKWIPDTYEPAIDAMMADALATLAGALHDQIMQTLKPEQRPDPELRPSVGPSVGALPPVGG